MKRLLAVPLLLVTLSAAAQKPWELRVDLPLTVPIELPAVPPTNPFATPVEAGATPAAAPLLERLETGLPVLAAAYVDRSGACRRAVLLRVPFPGLASELNAAVLETTFTPARSRGEAAPAWLTLEFAMSGRVKEGRVLRLVPTAPDPASPPRPEPVATPAADPRDLALPATPAAQLDQLPAPKRFRASLPSRSLRQAFRVLAEVSAAGRCTRVVFLACPDGLREYLLRSLGAWTFRPALAGGAAAVAWVQLDGEVELELSSLSADRVKVSQGSYPAAAAAPGAAPPPGG